MLYIAFVKNKPRWQLGDVDLTAKSRRWWNEAEKPAGLRTVGFWGSLSSEAPDVIVFEAESHEDIRKVLWNPKHNWCHRTKAASPPQGGVLPLPASPGTEPRVRPGRQLRARVRRARREHHQLHLPRPR